MSDLWPPVGHLCRPASCPSLFLENIHKTSITIFALVNDDPVLFEVQGQHAFFRCPALATLLSYHYSSLSAHGILISQLNIDSESTGQL